MSLSCVWQMESQFAGREINRPLDILHRPSDSDRSLDRGQKRPISTSAHITARVGSKEKIKNPC